MQTLDFHALDETEFEEFCLDLLKELGFVNVDWRKGTGLQASPSDRGRDIQADLERADVDGAHYVEKWFVECKHHKRGVPPEKVQGLLAWAHAERPHVALIIASNFLSNPTKDYLRNYEQNNRPPFRIKVWERPTLDGITKGRDAFLARYLLSEMRTESEILAAEGELFNRVWYRRHQTLMRIHESRDRDDSTVKTDVPFDLTDAEAREILGRATSTGLEIAESDARRVEELLGRDALGPYSDVEWGMILGKLSALRWVHGDDWDNLRS